MRVVCDPRAMRSTDAPVTRLVKRAFQATTELAREQRALKRAMKTMPKPVPWDWAAPRLVPFLSGPCFDPPGEPLVRTRSSIGPMVEFGVDLGGAFSYVDERVAQRWECSPDQLLERSLENLGLRASRLDASMVRTGVMSGRGIRLLRGEPRWATSLLLVPDQLFRLFGDHDQWLGAPTTSILVSIPADTPTAVVADIVVDFEAGALRPLWLGLFALIDGRIGWCDDPADDELDR